jgi:hypothetical protein
MGFKPFLRVRGLTNTPWGYIMRLKNTGEGYL